MVHILISFRFRVNTKISSVESRHAKNPRGRLKVSTNQKPIAFLLEIFKVGSEWQIQFINVEILNFSSRGETVEIVKYLQL